MGQAETASVERPFAAGHLQNTVSLDNEDAQKQHTSHHVNLNQLSVKSAFDSKLAWTIPVSRVAHTQILSNTIH